MKEYINLMNEYACCKISDEEIQEDIKNIIKDNFDKNNNIETYEKIFGLIDLTSLNSTDTEESIKNMTEKVNQFKKEYKNTPNVAAICVYPALVNTVNKTLKNKDIQIASVAAGFPTPQTFIEVKIAETALAVMEGATEIDMVFPINSFLEEKYDEVVEEITEIKATCKNVKLKVILETGALKTAENIAKAAVLSMASGADFIKTSTGKISTGATLEAAYVMCKAIKEFEEKNEIQVGFKAAGGISKTEEAINYYTIVNEVLGEKYLNKNLFRIGASRLANNLLSLIHKNEIKYF